MKKNPPRRGSGLRTAGAARKLFRFRAVNFSVLTYHVRYFQWAKGFVKCIECFSTPSKFLSVCLTLFF